MKKILLGLLFVIAVMTSSAQIIVSSNITTNTTWTNNNIYILQGFIKVQAGATLTIEPGTIVKGDFVSKGALIIERDGMIMAQGTPEQPIVFTSQKPAGQRSYGDWGGVILCGRGAVNQPANAQNGTQDGEAVVEGGVGSIYGGGNNPNNADNSGVMSYCRIEFGGIPFQPNSEINGLTMCAVGSATTLDHIQVSYCGDDAFEWFGGAANLKNIIAYRNWDDDFDTDFGFRGKVQFALSVRDPQIADQSGSNGFESDNDATGSISNPNTEPHFSNVTIIGPYLNDANTINSNYKRGAHLRRNTSCSIFNSVFAGYPVGLLIEASSTQGNATNGILRFQNNVLAQMGDTLATTTGANPNNVNGDFDITPWFNSMAFNNTTFNTAAELGFNSTALNNPDLTLTNGSPLLSGASFTDSYVSDSFFEQVAFRGAFGTDDWTSCWAEWDPQNEPYTSAINNSFTSALSADGEVAFCQGGSVTLNASSTSTSDVVYTWSNGQTGSSQTFGIAGTYSVVAENANNCTAASNEIVVSVYSTPEVSITADGSTSFCTGGSVTLTSSASNGNIWSTDATSSSIIVAESGSYSVEYTDANGCTATSNSINVSVSSSPVPTITSSGSTEICDGASITLTASSSETYSWSLNGQTIAGSGQSIDATLEGVYTVSVTNTNECDGTGESVGVLITVNPTPTADFTINQNNGSLTVQFLNSSINATSYSWNFGDNNTSSAINPSHTYTSGGDYTVTLTAINGDCSDTYTFDIMNVTVGEIEVFTSLNLYPNPSNGMVTLNFDANFNGKVLTSVYDIYGQLVNANYIAVQSGTQNYEMDLSSLSNGIYFVSLVKEGGESTMIRLMIQK